MKIAFNNLNAQWNVIKGECFKELHSLFEKSNFILGEQVGQFEKSFSDYTETTYAVGVSSGTDALKLAAQSLLATGRVPPESSGICVVIPANTFIATLLGIEQAFPDAHFQLIDCDDYYQMDTTLLHSFIKSNRHHFHDIVIVPVHLYGYTCNMDEIGNIASEYGCRILSDSSQAHGAFWKENRAGSMATVSAFSLYPGKNLGGAGDGGIVTTDSYPICESLRLLRNLGSNKKYEHEVKGGNHRLDTIQAIILNAKLKHLDTWNDNRRRIVRLYENNIDNPHIILPKTPRGCTPVHHIYPIRTNYRDRLMAVLEDHGIQTGIHYPIPIERMSMYRQLGPCPKTLRNSGQLLSLPIHPFMREQEVKYVYDTLNSYKE